METVACEQNDKIQGLVVIRSNEIKSEHYRDITNCSISRSDKIANNLGSL